MLTVDFDRLGLRPGDRVVIGQACSEPLGLVSQLLALAPKHNYFLVQHGHMLLARCLLTAKVSQASVLLGHLRLQLANRGLQLLARVLQQSYLALQSI